MEKYKFTIEGMIDDKNDVRINYHGRHGRTHSWLFGAGEYIRKIGTKVHEPVFYKYGNLFRDLNGEKCMIIQVENDVCCLATLHGNRFDDPMKVSNSCRITEVELKTMAGCLGPLTKIEK